MAIYYRITNYSATAVCRVDGERKALCPDCEAEVCVFCEDECPRCGKAVW